MNPRIAFASILLLCSAAVAPAAASASLGLILDSANAQSAQDGLHVLGATPGSIADQLGLRPGDVLVDVNGTSLVNLGADASGRPLAASALNSTVAGLPGHAALRLRVLRDGVTIAMNASLQGAAVPASAALAESSDPSTDGGCGRISTFDVAPRSKHLYRAKILLLDGASPGPTGTPSFRVAAGTHKLLVAENIPTEEMGIGAFATLRSRRDTSKELSVTVRANTTALLAARLNTDKVSDFAHGAYWDPVIWREIPERCP